MKKIVTALKGVSNVGKSETIKKVYEMLKNKYPEYKIVSQKIYKVDITVILDIKKVKIGIESQGDPNSRLIGSLTSFIKEGCQIIICATRTYGKTEDAVIDLEKRHGYELIWFPKGKANPREQEGCNLAMSEGIIKEVEIIINP